MRHLLGLLGLLLLTAGLAGVLVPDWLAAVGVPPLEYAFATGIRLGIVLCLLWLAHPQLAQIPAWIYWTGGALILIVVVVGDWRAILIAIPLAVLLFLTAARFTSTRRN